MPNLRQQMHPQYKIEIVDQPEKGLQALANVYASKTNSTNIVKVVGMNHPTHYYVTTVMPNANHAYHMGITMYSVAVYM